MEGVECACMGRGRVCIGKGSSGAHGEREVVCIWKRLSVKAWGEGVYMEGVE